MPERTRTMAVAQQNVQNQIAKAREERDWYFELVRKQVDLAAVHPRQYARRVRWLAALAYGYIFLILALCLALIVGMIWMIVKGVHGNAIEVRLLFVGLVLVWAIVSSLYVKIEPPSGLHLSRDKAPGLYAAIDSIAESSGAPKVDEIHLTNEFNAGAGMYPRFGILGFYRNILYLGLPMLLALSPDEMRSVIAHEFGHFSGEHGKTGAWAYRIDQTWQQLRTNLQRRASRGAVLFRPFFNWYAPRFSATSFALRRANEYEADAAAARLVGTDLYARTMMKLDILAAHLEKEFWSELHQKAKTMPEPQPGGFKLLVDSTRVAPDEDLAREALDKGLAENTSYDDVHPSLTERLTALGRLPKGDLAPLIAELRVPPERSAAEALLGKLLPEAIQSLEQTYNDKVRAKWQTRHQEYRESMGRLLELDMASGQRTLTEKESLDRAHLTYQLCDNQVAIPVLRETYEQFPESAPANYMLGQALLDEREPEGLAFLERAVSIDRSYEEVARRLRFTYARKIGDYDKAEALRQEAFEEQVKRELDEEEARKVNLKTEFAPSGLDSATVQRLQARLKQIAKLDSAYLVSRRMSATGQIHHFLIVFHKRAFSDPSTMNAQLAEAVRRNVPLPPRTWVYSPSQRKPWLRKLETVTGAKIL